MEQMEDKDKHMVTESRNRKKLLEEVESVVVSFLSIYQVFHFSEQALNGILFNRYDNIELN